VTWQVSVLGQNRTEILCEAFLFQHFLSVLDDLNIHSLVSIKFSDLTKKWAQQWGGENVKKAATVR